MAPADPDTPTSRQNSTWGNTLWGNSATRSYTKRMRPMLSRVATKRWERDADLELEQPGHRNASKWTTLLLSYQCIGVVFGDLGTSPLYTFAGIFADERLEPTPENFIGAASLIIWTLLSLALVKYALIVLRADDNGQGGSMALYSQLRRQGLLSRHAAERSTKGVAQSGSGRHPLSEANAEGAPFAPQDWKQRLIGATPMQAALRVMVVIGVGLILGDGVLTPAVTIVSAMEGLELAVSGITRGTIVGLSCAIIAGLFLVQRFGAAKLGFAFSPIVLTYLLFNSVVGVYNIAYWSSFSILKAFSPHYWFNFFLRNGNTGWRVLSGVLLCSTGTEAMFADLGHFNRPAIQLAFIFVVLPALFCMYLGQAAYLVKNPAGVSTAFFASLPGGKPLFWPMFVVITAASIVASQALISASYQIVAQAITQGFFPRFTIAHTSREHSGQIFIATVNYTLMTLTIIITVAFRTSARLSEAYGLAVIMDMFLTTCFMSLILLTVWRKNVLLAPLFFVIFGLIEWCFLSSSLLKVPHGAWFTLMMAGIYAVIMSIWFWGANRKARHFKGTQQSLAQFLLERKQPPPQTTPVSSKHAMSPAVSGALPDVLETTPLVAEPRALQREPLPGVGLFYSGSLHGVPHVMTQLGRMFPGLPQVSIFMTNRSVPLPEVLDTERLLVQQLGAPGFYHIVARYGYTQRIRQGPEFVKGVMRHIQAQLYRSLCYRLADSEALAPLLQRNKLSRPSAAIVNAVVGDMYGEGHDSPQLTKRTVSSAHMNLSTHGLSLRGGRRSGRRPTILDENGQVAWPSGAASANSSAHSAAEAGALPAVKLYQAPAHADGGDNPSGTPSASGCGSDGAATPLSVAAPGSPNASSRGRTRLSRTAAEAMVAAAGDGEADDAFEMAMESIAKDLDEELSKVAMASSGKDAAGITLLRKLAAELALVSNAARAGTLGYVLGRSHAKLPPIPRWRDVPRRYCLELPFAALVKNTEQDMDLLYGIPPEKLLEVGLAFSL